MAALGGMDFTDVALRFFTNVRDHDDTAALGNAAAFATLLSGLTPCTAQVAPPELLPVLPGLTSSYSVGPCLDLRAQAVLPPSTDSGLSI
jgi:hypothetical protein